jgi:hypothetical protein
MPAETTNTQDSASTSYRALIEQIAERVWQMWLREARVSRERDPQTSPSHPAKE